VASATRRSSQGPFPTTTPQHPGTAASAWSSRSWPRPASSFPTVPATNASGGMPSFARTSAAGSGRNRGSRAKGNGTTRERGASLRAAGTMAVLASPTPSTARNSKAW